MYRSEIRPSQIEKLKDKVKNKKYGKYLLGVNLTKCRAFESVTIHYDFPVTALIGPNGGGKTTILGASALLYRSVAPRQFFTRNNQIDQGMRNWSISYEAIDKTIHQKDSIRRKAHFSSEKWSRDAIDRDVIFFRVSRTVPAVEISKLSRFANKNVIFRQDEMSSLNGSAEYITKILGKDVSEYQILKSVRYGNIELLSGQTSDKKTYSEFHFGAGESSVIKMVIGIEQASENSLILIEEIENGLHPLATLRLVDYLIEVSERKKIQVIFTTHSEYAIKPLPDEAVWAAVDGNAIQGKLDILSLRSLVGEVNSELIIFTEDEFAKEWLLSMMRFDSKVAVDAIEIYPMSGDGCAVKSNEYHNSDPSVVVPSICVIDGDSQQQDNTQLKVFRLPGEAPERCVFYDVLDVINDCSGILAVRCSSQFKDEQVVKSVIMDVRNTNYDHHLLFSQIGAKLGFVNESVIRTAFLTTWCEYYPDKVKDFVSCLDPYLPKKP